MKLTDNQREALGDAYHLSFENRTFYPLHRQSSSCRALVRRGLMRRVSIWGFKITAEGRKFIEEGR